MSKKREKLKFSNLKLRQNKSSVTNSLTENEKISSYFPKISQEIISQVETDISEDSPKYNDAEQTDSKREFKISSSILDMSSTDANCFKSPRVKPKKQLKLLPGTKPKVPRRKTVPPAEYQEYSLALESTGLSGDGDMNVEHLQLALAMSRSLQGEEEPPSLPNTQQTPQSLKETLKQFGFKSDAKISRSSLPKPIPQRRKKIKFLRTALMTRTEVDRNNIIEDKVAQIITNIASYQEHLDRKYPAEPAEREIADIKPGSFVLRELYQCGAPLFHRSRLELSESAAYHGELVDPKEAAAAGALLRDWHAIPGRERTPPRFVDPSSQPLPLPETEPCSRLQPSPQPQLCVSPELFSDDEYPQCQPEPLMPLTKDTNKLNDTVTDHNASHDIFHFESFNDAVCFDLTQSSTSLSPDLKNRDNIHLSSDDSIEMFENDACLNISNAIQIINSEENEDVGVLQMAETDKEDVVDLTQNSKDSEIELGTVDQVEFNDSKIEYLIRKAALNNSRGSCDLKEINISNNYKINVTELEDLICDAASTSSRASMCDQVVDISGQCIDLSDDEEMPPDHIPLRDSPVQAEMLSSSQSSAGSGLDDAELNYSSLHSEVHQKTALSFNINADEEQNMFSSINQYNGASMRHPRIACLSMNDLDGRKSSKLFNESLEKILEENDPWANDVIELHAETPQCSLVDPPQARECPPAPGTPSPHLSPTLAPHDALIIKTHNVTPMADYHQMDTPKRNRELDKYGIKPLKRAKGVKILEYIYNSTHPVAGCDTATEPHRSSKEEEQEAADERSSKRRKKEKYVSNSQVRRRRSQCPPQSAGCSRAAPAISIVGDLLSGQDVEEDLIFERTQSSRVSSCRIPLHIAWHNFLCCRPDIEENILLYEPLQLEDIHLQFKNLGFKFHIQDLTTFFDKRCITIRTTQTNRVKKKSSSQN